MFGGIEQEMESPITRQNERYVFGGHESEMSVFCDEEDIVWMILSIVSLTNRARVILVEPVEV